MATELGSPIDRQSVLFVTGCSTGFGRELAKQLLARGNSVTVTASKPESLSAFSHMEKALVLGLDVTGPAEITGAVHEAEALFGRIEAVVNKAGLGYFAAVEEDRDAEIRRMFAGNLFGLAAVTRSVVSGMRARRQNLIVKISSIGGLRPFPAIGRYNALELAVEGLSEAPWKDVNLPGIRAMLVEPSGFRSEWTGRSADGSKIPVAYYGTKTGAGRADVRPPSGRQAGDPVRAIEAIIKVAEGAEPPHHLVLGNEAYDAARAELRDPHKDFVNREAVSRGADLPTGNMSRVARSALASWSPDRMPDTPIPSAPAAAYESRTFDELLVGKAASLSHTVTQRDIDRLAAALGDMHPAHVDPACAATDMFHHIINRGIRGAGLISAALGTKLPVPGTSYLGQDLRFQHPVAIEDATTASLTVKEKRPEKDDVALANHNGVLVITGIAETRALRDKLPLLRVTLPYVHVGRHDTITELLARAAAGPAISTSVVHPVDASALLSAFVAATAGLIVPVLVEPVARIRAGSAVEPVDISTLRLLDGADAPASAARAVALARARELGMVMKGDLHPGPMHVPDCSPARATERNTSATPTRLMCRIIQACCS